MDPYLRAFFLVTAFLVTLVVAAVMVRRMLRDRSYRYGYETAPAPGDAAGRTDSGATEPAGAAGSDGRGAREWRGLATGVPRLLELLVAESALTAEQAQQATVEQRRTGHGVGPVLARLGYPGEDKLFSWLSRRYGLPIVNLEALDVPEDTIKLVRREIAQRYHVLPVRRVGDTLPCPIRPACPPSTTSSSPRGSGSRPCWPRPPRSARASPGTTTSTTRPRSTRSSRSIGGSTRTPSR
jgi:hypothetical protein